MTREEAIAKLEELSNEVYNEDSDGYSYAQAIDLAIESLSADEEKENGTFVNRDNWNFNCNDSNRTLVEPKWIPCSERLPKVNQRVLLATNNGRVFVGYREKPDLVWQVTEKDGRKHWVYDPENYTDDIEILPKNEDCGFSKDDVYSDGFLSVASVNYDDRFEGVTAWMPLPTPYKGGDTE